MRAYPYSRNPTLPFSLSWLALAGALLMLGACARAVPGPQDETVDAATGGPDATTPPGADAAAPPIDASAQVDAPAAPEPCDTLYGDIPGYVLCEEAADSCRFSAVTGGGNCDALCAAYSGTCIAAFDNDPGAPCAATQQDSCATNADDEICVCSRE